MGIKARINITHFLPLLHSLFRFIYRHILKPAIHKTAIAAAAATGRSSPVLTVSLGPDPK